MPVPEPTSPHQEDDILKVESKDFPQKFHPLVSAVLAESGGCSNVWVDFEAVRRHLGNNEAIRQLGWMTYTQYVQNACAAGHLQMKIAENNSKRIKLVAPNVNLDEREDLVSHTHDD